MIRNEGEMKTPEQIATTYLTEHFPRVKEEGGNHVITASVRELKKVIEKSIKADRAQRDPFTGRVPLIPEGHSQLGRYRIHHQKGI